MLLCKAYCLWISLLILLLSFGCSNCDKDKDKSTQGNQLNNGSAVHERIGELSDASLWGIKLEELKDKNSTYYISVGMETQEQEPVAIAQYFISAQVLEGQGDLFASSEKLHNKFIYAIPLDQEQCLAKLLPYKGDSASFKKNKPVKFKCKYVPSENARQGDQHRLNVKISKRAYNGELVEYKQAEVIITIKLNPKPGVSLEEVLDNSQDYGNSFKVNIHIPEVHIPEEKPATNRYFLSAQVLKGSGKVLTAEPAQEQLDLAEECCLDQLAFVEHDVLLPHTKSIELPCKYEPEPGAQPGSQDKVLIKLQEKDQDGKVLQHVEDKITFKLQDTNHEPLIAIKKAGKYCFMTLTPVDQHVDLNQYFICVERLKGQGMLYGALEKVNGKFQYKVPLDKEVPLSQLIPASDTSLEAFQQQGKPVKYKFSYVAADPSCFEEEQLLVKVAIKDSTATVVQEEKIEVNFKANSKTVRIVP